MYKLTEKAISRIMDELEFIPGPIAPLEHICAMAESNADFSLEKDGKVEIVLGPDIEIKLDCMDFVKEDGYHE